MGWEFAPASPLPSKTFTASRKGEFDPAERTDITDGEIKAIMAASEQVSPNDVAGSVGRATVPAPILSPQRLCDKVDAVVAQMHEILRDYKLEGYNTIWCHKIRDWMKVLEGNGLTVDDFAHYKDPKYPEFTVLPKHLQDFLDEEDKE